MTMIRLKKGRASMWCAAAMALAGAAAFAALPVQAQTTYADKIGIEAADRPVAFVDVMKDGGRLFQDGHDKLVPFDENGWPKTDGVALIFDERAVPAWNPPIDDPEEYQPDMSGTYAISFHGQAQLEAAPHSSELKFEHQKYDAATNTTTVEVELPEGQPSIMQIRFTHTRRTASSAENTGITDLHAIRPGFAPETKQVFDPAFLRALAPFAYMRFMGWLGTNYDPGNYADPGHHLFGWEKRSLPTDEVQGMGSEVRAGAVGISWEYVILLANALHKDVWINVPVSATGADPRDRTSYVYKLAELFKNGDAFTNGHGLAQGLHIYIEHSNEVWNRGFRQYQWNRDAAADEVKQGHSPLDNDGSTNPEDWANRRHAKRLYEIAKIFEAVYGPGSLNTTIRPIYAWWQLDEGPASNANKVLAWCAKTYGPPKNYFYAMAQGDYFDNPDYAKTDTVAKVLASMRRTSDKDVEYVQRDLVTARQYGLRLATYEGGPATDNEGKQDTVNVGVQIEASRDARMGELVDYHIRHNWFEQGGDLFGYFVLSSAFARYGNWGATDDYHNLDTAKYKALLRLVGEAPRAKKPEAPPGERAEWTAKWIAHPTAPLREPAVFHFRKTIRLGAQPEHYWVDVSADNRFVLYVNGERVGEGPARGDLLHWRYEHFDLAPALHKGSNTIAALVWNWGIDAPLAQISNRTAFLMQGETEAERAVNTNESWQVETEPGLSFIQREGKGFWFYWAADPGEKLDARSYDWDWKQGTGGSNWVRAVGAMRESIYAQTSRPGGWGETPPNPWVLMRDPLPQMEYSPAEPGRVVRADLQGAEKFPASPVTIPAHTQTAILLDRGTMITGYPKLEVSGGAGAKIEIGYTEALYDSNLRRGNRNDVGERKVLGLDDAFEPDGSAHRTFEPLWFRTWRYLELRVETADAPLTLDGLTVHFSAFPFEERGSFASSDPELAKIWEICWRTARLGAHETYMDTPFWEQLQYVDDTRIQTLISYTVAGDDRLARQALHAYDDSRVPEGITQSRYPSLLPQFIPNFSLSYVDMLDDYWMYRPDATLVKQLLPGTRPVLDWFLERQRADGWLEHLPYWNAVDSPAGVRDFPREDAEGRSALLTLIFAESLGHAADLEDAMGDRDLAAKYRSAATRAKTAVYAACWDPQAGMLADTPQKNSFSQHTNIYGILTDAIPLAKQANVLAKIRQAKTPDGVPIAETSLHYQFYLSRAIEKVGAEYLDTLDRWRRMPALGLTTTPEYEDPTRSDTHAWSAHPIYDLLTLVAGIHPAAPGFAKVRIAPHPGGLDHFEASMPHEGGPIRVAYRKVGESAQFTITLPNALDGTLEWGGKSYRLHAGEQQIRLAE